MDSQCVSTRRQGKRGGQGGPGSGAPGHTRPGPTPPRFAEVAHRALLAIVQVSSSAQVHNRYVAILDQEEDRCLYVHCASVHISSRSGCRPRDPAFAQLARDLRAAAGLADPALRAAFPRPFPSQPGRDLRAAGGLAFPVATLAACPRPDRRSAGVTTGDAKQCKSGRLAPFFCFFPFVALPLLGRRVGLVT